MKRIVSIGSCLISLLALSAAGWAQTAPKDIQAYYTRCAQAMEKRDVAAVTKLFAPNIVAVDTKGRVMKSDQVIQSTAMALSMLSNVRMRFTILSATVKGNRATVLNDVLLSGDMTNPQTHKTSKMVTKQHCKDVLVKSAAGWRMEKTTTLKETTTIDGKPAPSN
jgi:ketosteroid isomerase-like protein